MAKYQPKPTPGTKTEAIIALATHTDATPPEIAKSVNTSRQAVHQALDRYGLEPNALKTFKENRADLLAGMQEKIYQAVDSDSIKKMIERRGMTDLGILYDKERIERGLSDTASKPMILVQINAGAGATVKASTVDNPVDNSTKLIGAAKDYGS